MWGEELNSEEDVWEVFSNYLSGAVNKHDTKVGSGDGDDHGDCYSNARVR